MKLLVVSLLLASPIAVYGSTHAAGDLCCGRTALFLPINPPPELESSLMIDSAVYGTLRGGSIFCDGTPIQYDELDWEGRQQLEQIVDAISAVEGAPLDLEAQQIFEIQLDVDYVWRARLTLDKVDEIVPGDKQEGDPATVWGDWTLNLALQNVQFNETVKEVEVFWNGLANGWTSKGWEKGSKENAIKDMVREHFVPITQVLYDYERIPHSSDPRPERETIGSDEEMVITVEQIHDHQSRPSKPWQRVVVEVKEGKLLNGTPVEANTRKLYAFAVGESPLQLKYKSPVKCETKTEKIKVYNSCDWGLLQRMGVTAPEQEIGSTDFEIVCADGKVEFNERFRWPPRAETRCNYEEPPDVVSFKLVPTRDPCIFTLKGGVSNPVTRKEYCRSQHPTWYQESWFEHERQTRLVGGTVDFRDKRIPPFRPWLEHRRNTARCDHHTAKDHGEEKRFSRGCFKPPKEWESTYLATPDVSRSFWGMPLQDGYVEDHRLGPQQRFSYTLHIDEKPFRRLDERCRKYTESHVPEAPQHTIKSGLGAPSETAFVRDTLDTTQKETDSSSLAQEHSPPGSESEDRALDRSQASLSYSKAGASETSGSKLPDESLSTHSPAPIAAFDMLEQLMPEDGPPGWFTPQSAYESSQFAARMWVKAPDHLSISLFAYDANEDASRVFARKTGTKLVVRGFPAVETSKEVTILIGRYLLMLKGKAELIREFLPYFDLAPTSPANAVVQ